MQRDIQEQTKDLEFLVGKLQAAREETAQKLFVEKSPMVQKIIRELIAAKEIKVLLSKSEALCITIKRLILPMILHPC